MFSVAGGMIEMTKTIPPSHLLSWVITRCTPDFVASNFTNIGLFLGYKEDGTGPLPLYIIPWSFSSVS
jgi:hypothetical protein